MIAALHRPLTCVRSRLRLAAVASLVLTLLACGTPPAPQPGLSNSARPVARPALPQAGKPEHQIRKERAARASAILSMPQTAESRQVSEYLAAVQTELIGRGLLRTESVHEDAGLTVDHLTEDFIQIALRDEYRREGEHLVASSHPAPLRRWQDPVRFQIEFGPSVSPGIRSRIRSHVAAFAGRLNQVTGHPVTVVTEGGNFTVLVLSEDERRVIGPRLRELVPGIPEIDVSAMQGLALQNYCTVFAYSRGAQPVYVRAVALLRSELPLRLEMSCVHEELAQGMGLANDSPAARPTIFNDDEEFAFLTRHDELLLKMLYDPRLRPGMVDDEARPIARRIAGELLGAETE